MLKISISQHIVIKMQNRIYLKFTLPAHFRDYHFRADLMKLGPELFIFEVDVDIGVPLWNCVDLISRHRVEGHGSR